MRIGSRPPGLTTARSLGVALIVAACGGATGTPVAGDGVLAVTNTSDSVVYVQFGGADGSTITYRVDPGAVGRAEAADPAAAPLKLRVVTASCQVLTQQSDPVLGRLVIEGRGTLSTAEDDPEVMIRPLLPTDDACP